MSPPKLIVVFGATGAQGSGLVRAIQNDPSGSFKARVATRNPEGEKAKALAALGAEVVKCDAFKEGDIVHALEGAYGAYFVTWSFEPAPMPEKEIQTVKDYATAAKKAGLKHAIFSSTENTRDYVPLDDDRMPTLDGKWKVPHFEAKGGSEHFFTDLNVPTTFLLCGFYYDNLLTLFPPTKAADGRYAITIPLTDKKIAWIAAEDIGKTAYGIFKAGPKECANKHVGASGEHLSVSDVTRKIAEAKGMDPGEFNCNNFVTPEIFRSFGFPGCEALGNMFRFETDFNDVYNANRSTEQTRKYNPDALTFKDWLADHIDEIPFVGEDGSEEGQDPEGKLEDEANFEAKNIEQIGFSLTLDDKAARLRSAMIQKEVDVWAKAFSIADENGDGQISLQEALKVGITEADFKAIDADGNKLISQEEFGRYAHTLGPELAKARAKFFILGADTDGDGMVSLKEALASGITEEDFRVMDADGDGQVTEQEFTEHLARQKESIEKS